MTGFSALGVLNDVIILDGVTGTFSNGFINANNSGIKMAGSYSSNILTFQNVTITESIVSAFWHSANNPGGTVNVNNCNWYNSGGNFWADQAGAATYTVTFRDSIFLNAGFPSTTAGARNFSITTSGDVNFYNCVIGRSSATALANYYIEAGGTGALVLTDCTFTSLVAPAGGGNEIAGTQVFKIAGGLGNRYRQYYAPTAPLTGTWNLGDRVFNSAPSVGANKGWICTVAGTPGTWVSEGIL
jgi:hypothetical protein